jgi:hypothetical protein
VAGIASDPHNITVTSIAKKTLRNARRDRQSRGVLIEFLDLVTCDFADQPIPVALCRHDSRFHRFEVSRNFLFGS